VHMRGESPCKTIATSESIISVTLSTVESFARSYFILFCTLNYQRIDTGEKVIAEKARESAVLGRSKIDASYQCCLQHHRTSSHARLMVIIFVNHQKSINRSLKTPTIVHAKSFYFSVSSATVPFC